MVAGADKQVGIRAVDCRDALSSCVDPHDETVFSPEAIAVSEALPPFQEDSRLTTVVQHHPQTALDPLVQGQGHGGRSLFAFISLASETQHPRLRAGSELNR
jgi:hypothetical protein